MTSALSPQPPAIHRSEAARRHDSLVLDLKQEDHRVELHVAGDLDRASAPRFMAAMAWLRHRCRQMIVIDTRQLDFVDIAGYRAFTASLEGPDGASDPRVIYVVGDALARLQRRLMAVTGIASPRLS